MSKPEGDPEYSVTSGAATSALSVALERIGDRWTLLTVAALLEGPRRFGELEQSIDGIATNVLTTRLRALERLGVVVALPYSERPLRFTYQLTDAGHALSDAIHLLALWGAGTLSERGSLVHSRCATALEMRYYCPTCDELVTDPDEQWL